MSLFIQQESIRFRSVSCTLAGACTKNLGNIIISKLTKIHHFRKNIPHNICPKTNLISLLNIRVNENHANCMYLNNKNYRAFKSLKGKLEVLQNAMQASISMFVYTPTLFQDFQKIFWGTW